MKKLLLMCMMALGLGVDAQITVGSGNTTTNVVPWSANYGYSYHQMIYPQSTITVGGTIASLTFTSAGTIPTTATGATPNTPQAANSSFRVYIGHTTKALFGSVTDWEPLTNLTLVYDGTLTMPTTSGQQLNIPLTTPFTYNNTDNLVIAIHEYSPGYANYSWLGNGGQTNMNLHIKNDTANPDPASPVAGVRGSITAKVVLGGLVATTPPTCSTVSAPANASTGISVTPTISWSQSPLATSYEVAIGTTPGSANVMPLTDVGNVLSYTVPAANALAYSTPYYVTVYPKNAVGSATGCTSNMFTTLVIPCPSVSAPASAATGTSLTPAFTWSAVTGATGYKLSIGSTAGATNILNNADLGNVLTYTYNQTPTLNYNTKYFYTVNSYSATSNSTGCTERNFTTKTLCPTVSAPTAAATGVSVTPTFTWAANTDATGYRISIGTSAGATDVMNNVDLGNVLTYTLPTPLAYGVKYFYTINGYNATASSLGCTERNFTTLTLCPTVSAPASNAVGVSVNPTFTWAAVTGVTGYRISIGTTSGGTDVLNLFDVGNVLTYVLPTPLNNATQYYYTIVGYVGTQVSSGCTERSFTTVCGAFTPGYINNFATFPGTCWSLANGGSPATGPGTGTTNYWVADGFLNVGGTGAARINLFSTGRAGWLRSPAFNLSAGGYRLKFDYGLTGYNVTTTSAMGSDDVVQFVVSTDGGATWTVLQTWNTANTPSNTSNAYTLNLAAYTGANTVFAVYGSDGTVDDTQDYDFFVDNFIIEAIPTCEVPVGVSSSAVTTNAATISWTAPSPVPGSGYEVYYSTSNVAPNTSTVLNSSNSAVSSSTSASLGGLAAATNYYVWVRSVCSATDKSVWSTSATFKTLCNPVPVPFSENFSTGVLANCWSTYSTNNTGLALWQFGNTAQDYGTTYSAAGQNNTAGQFAYVDASDPYTGTGVSDVTLASPAVNLTGLSVPTLEFRWFKNHGTAVNPTSPPAYDNNKLTVAVKDVSSSTWETVFTSTTNAPTWRTETIALPSSYVGKTVQVRFVVDKNVAGNGYYYDNVLLDDVSLKEAVNLATAEVNSNKAGINAYPNPFADVLNISDIKDVKSIMISDMSGKIVRTIVKPESTLRLGDLNAGMYLVILNMNDGSRQTIKAIKK